MSHISMVTCGLFDYIRCVSICLLEIKGPIVMLLLPTLRMHECSIHAYLCMWVYKHYVIWIFLYLYGSSDNWTRRRQVYLVLMNEFSDIIIKFNVCGSD